MATYLNIWRLDQSGGTWTLTPISTTGLPPHFFTALAVEDASAGSFYVTLGGGGVAHVYYYDGSAWHAAMPTSVVDVPTHAVVVDPANPAVLYAGTDVGCWKGVKSAGPTWNWTLFSQGLPEVAIIDLVIYNPARLLRASTHGRGVWEIDLAATTGLDPDIYLRVNYSDTGRLNGSRKPWVEGSPDPTNVGNVLYHWMSADIKVRRNTLPGLPPLSSPVNYDDFAVNIGDYLDPTTHIETADQSGTDRIFRSSQSQSQPGAGRPSSRIAAGGGRFRRAPGRARQLRITHQRRRHQPVLAGRQQLEFVDPATPFRTLPRDLDVRTPQVVEYDLDFSTLGLPSTHTHACLAAFVTTPSDPITSVSTNLDQLTMSDKHVAHRNTHLVAVPPSPGTEPGSSQYAPQTVLIDFHNATEREAGADLIFRLHAFPGTA